MRVKCPNCWRQLDMDSESFKVGLPSICHYCGGFFVKSRKANFRTLKGPERCQIEINGVADGMRKIRAIYCSSLPINQHRRKNP